MISNVICERHSSMNSEVGIHKVCYLRPNPEDRNKSYYKKARVVVWEDNWVGLVSYNTLVVLLSPFNEFYKVWSGYSKTSMNHINTFCDDFGIPKFNKSEWQSTYAMSPEGFYDFRTHHNCRYDYINFAGNRQYY